MKAFRAIGPGKSLKFIFGEIIHFLLACCILPPVRIWILRLLGAKVGKGSVILRFDFINYYRGSFSNLTIGKECFIGNQVLFDLADRIEIEDGVTVSERTVLLTHLNVGFSDHPLQKYFPSEQKPIVIRHGTFIGANATIICGVEIGPLSFVAAGAVVTKSLPGKSLLAGVPAKVVRMLEA
jgi:acetyltransferase-like isoleucine patch superfamily enzyme